MTRRLAIVGLALPLACGPEPATTTSSSSSSSGSTTTTAPTSSPTVTGTPITSSSAGTTSAEQTTTTTGEATTGDVIAATTTTGVEPCEDTIGATIDTDVYPSTPPDCVAPQIEWDGPHLDCRLDCSTLTQIHGEGPAAGLRPVTQVTFGVTYGACGHGVALYRLRLGNPAAPQLKVLTYLDCALDPWLGDHVVNAVFPEQPSFEVNMTLDSYAGDWISPDPVDPPRLFGSFSGALVGPFEAVHCAALDAYYDNCA